ncbi:MAG: FapA family protein [Peptococcaceae bacterium]|jgi:uncharacterized protein (DUF342 family)|nr:FapA family protein [Peptococcaceae bacterium]MDH7524064.1 FapA family protein [Peptococcaceae bacterium]
MEDSGVSAKTVRGRKYSLSKEPEGVYLTVSEEENLLFPATLDQLCAELAQRKIFFESETVEQCFAEASGRPVKISSDQEGYHNGTILRIRVTEDKLKAYLQVFPLRNGSKVSERDIENTLLEQGIKAGVKKTLFPEIVEKQDDYGEWLVAEGVPCIEGEDARLIFHFNPEGIDIKPQELADGSVDFYNLNLIQTVDSGSVLIEKIHATAGKDGLNVYGEEKKAKPGKDVRFPMGQNTQIVDNNTKLIATTSGHVVYDKKRVSVFHCYEVRGDVDFNTGNIKFPGNVIVYGNVKNNFEIEAVGDVEVHGNLEGLVKAGGNLQVKNGIVRGKAVVNGCVYARYIENGYVESNENIVVTEAIMHSTTKAAKKVTVGGKKGLLVGGSCCAGEEIRAKNIGSSSGTATTLEVGIRPEIRQEYKEVCRRLATLQEDCLKCEKIVKALQEIKKTTGSLPDNKNEIFLKVCRQQYQMTQEIENLKRRKNELENIFYNLEKARICVENKVFFGVTLYMGKSVFNVLEEMKSVVFKIEGFEIKHVPLRGR